MSTFYFCRMRTGMIVIPFVLSWFSSLASGLQEEANSLETVDWEAYYADMSALEEDESLLEQWSESVQELVEHPLGLNAASREELASLPFMNDQLVEEISYYLYRYGPMVDVSELRLIRGMDDVRYRLLCHLVCPGDTTPMIKIPFSWKNVLQQGKHDIRFQLGKSLEKKKGYFESTPLNQGYLGDAWSTTVRYGFSFKKHVQVGFTAQKDAGERWFTPGHGFDYVSAHLFLKRIGWCNAFILGDYNLTMGQGLICGQSFQLGKGAFSGNSGATTSSIKRHASTAESSYFKGVAFDINLLELVGHGSRHAEVSAVGFASDRRIDGSMNDGVFTGVLSTGMHRTQKELDQRHNVELSSAGCSITMRYQWIRIGLNHLSWIVDKPLNPEWQPYNQFQVRGVKGNNTSLDYRILIRQITCFGELAMDQTGYCAFQGGFYVLPVSSLSLSIHYRNHGIRYKAFFAGCFGENTRANNEHGVYASISWEAAKNVTLSAYLDHYLFPWLTYRCDERNGGNQVGIQGIFQLSPSTTIMMRCKERHSLQNLLSEKEKNPYESETNLQQTRLQLTEVREGLTYNTIMDATRHTYASRTTSTWGFSLSQSVNYSPRSIPCKATVKVSYFDVPCHENSIYSFEPTLPGASRFPSLYGEGVRMCLVGCWNMGDHTQWWLEVSRLKLTDKTELGTTLETVQGNHLTSIQLMVRLKL